MNTNTLPEEDDLPPAADTQPSAPTQAVALTPYAGQLAVLNPLLEAIAQYKAECAMDPAQHVWAPGTKPSVKREFFQERKMRGTRLRGDITRIAKQTRDDALKFQRDVIAAQDKLIAEVETVEGPWASAVQQVDADIAADAAARQKIIDDRVASRVALLNGLGIMVQLGMYEGETLAAMAENVFQSHYARDKALWDAAEIKKAEDAATLARLQAEEAARLAAQVEAKRLADEAEAARLEAQRVAQAAQQAKLDAAQAEQDRVTRENQAKQEAMDEQALKIKAATWTLRVKAFAAVKEPVPAGLEDADDAGFEMLLELATQARDARVAEEQRVAAEAESIRKTTEKIAADKAAVIEAARVEEARIESERVAAAADAARAAMLPDREAMEAYADELREVTRPVVHTEEARAAMSEWTERFNALVGELVMA